MRTSLVAIPVLCLALASCSSVDKTGRSSRGFYSPDFDTVWERAQITLMEEGYPPDMDASSKENKVLASRYATSLQPFSSRGYREKATLTFHEVPDAERRWTVEVNVLREINKEVKTPNNALLANWDDGTRVPGREAMIARRLETFFIPHDVSPQFRAAYGMPEAKRYAGDDGKPDTPIDPTERPR